MVVIAASSRADQLDAALRRPGRLDTEVEIGVPSPAQRLDIFRYCFGAAGLLSALGACQDGTGLGAAWPESGSTRKSWLTAVWEERNDMAAYFDFKSCPGRVERSCHAECSMHPPVQACLTPTISCGGRVLTARMKHSLSPAEEASIAAAAHGFVGADVVALTRVAGLHCLRRFTARTGAKGPLQVRSNAPAGPGWTCIRHISPACQPCRGSPRLTRCGSRNTRPGMMVPKYTGLCCKADFNPITVAGLAAMRHSACHPV